ncbi:helix-turn-helix domain-containing protein [Larkinella sp. C7]|jgi:hypothetical protein|uniref:AlbA family DNA-binding domain-containing protein n=1 Tax=Larkinella sp. C7 TaxID=2576607 RepID=UPI0011115FD7|nr:ATP-binding protein [Larkinella sp. C7]
MNFNFELDSKGYLKRRESIDLEYKQNFHREEIAKYAKTIAGMANNKGGQIIFGVKDKPHIPMGMTNGKFRDFDPVTLEQFIRDYFSEEIHWSLDILPYAEKEFGRIIIEESNRKPIVCKKTKDNLLREAAVYYRYRGESREIGYSELRNILDKEREKERLLWMKHISAISLAGPQNIHLLNSHLGQLTIGDKQVVLDKQVLKEINFIKEGQFTELDGAPTLKLIGEIRSIDQEELTAVSIDVMYPNFTADLIRRLNLNSHELKCVVWKLELRRNPIYHAEVSLGPKSNSISKYSEQAVKHILDCMSSEVFITTCLEEYKASHPYKAPIRNRRNRIASSRNNLDR